MANQIVSIDGGNGYTKAVAATRKRYKSTGFPSIRAASSGDRLGLGKDMELQYSVYDWNGFRYIAGDDVVTVSHQRLERHLGADRYANEFHQFLVAVALFELGVKPGPVDLTLFAPPGLFNAIKTDMKYRFEQKPVSLGVNGETMTWEYDQVAIWPEGIGAAACFILDDDGTVAGGEALAGEVLIIDSGAYTLDILQMTNGNFNPESLQHATWENQGLHTHILQPILQGLKRTDTEFSTMPVDHIDRVMRLGLVSGDYMLSWADLEVDIEPLVNRYSERYAEWIANNVIDGVYAGLRGIRAALVVGGGATLVSQYLSGWYGAKVIDPKSYATTKKIHPAEFNAVGGLRLARMQSLTAAK